MKIKCRRWYVDKVAEMCGNANRVYITQRANPQPTADGGWFAYKNEGEKGSARMLIHESRLRAIDDAPVPAVPGLCWGR